MDDAETSNSITSSRNTEQTYASQTITGQIKTSKQATASTTLPTKKKVVLNVVQKDTKPKFVAEAKIKNAITVAS